LNRTGDERSGNGVTGPSDGDVAKTTRSGECRVSDVRRTDAFDVAVFVPFFVGELSVHIAAPAECKTLLYDHQVSICPPWSKVVASIGRFIYKAFKPVTPRFNFR
jgi:hypothetical protein